METDVADQRRTEANHGQKVAAPGAIREEADEDC